MDLLAETFPTPELGTIWMNSPHPYLGYRKPLMVLADGEVDLVVKILEYIKSQMIQNL